MNVWYTGLLFLKKDRQAVSACIQITLVLVIGGITRAVPAVLRGVISDDSMSMAAWQALHIVLQSVGILANLLTLLFLLLRHFYHRRDYAVLCLNGFSGRQLFGICLTDDILITPAATGAYFLLMLAAGLVTGRLTGTSIHGLRIMDVQLLIPFIFSLIGPAVSMLYMKSHPMRNYL